jgi:hypothetical protein
VQIFISSRGPLVGVALASLGGLVCQFACARPGRSVIFAWFDLLRMESSGSKARRGAAWMWPKEGWPAQHGARGSRGVSLVEITTGVHRGAGGTWGAKKRSKLAMDVIRSMCTPNGIPRERRWLDFESAAAGIRHYTAGGRGVTGPSALGAGSAPW